LDLELLQEIQNPSLKGLAIYKLPEPEPTTVKAINLGSSQSYTAQDGTVFEADTTGIGNHNTRNSSIAQTEDDALYQSATWSPDGLSYDFALEQGTYQVDFHFAEIWSGAFQENGRVFDIIIEGNQVVDDLDVYAEVGAQTALTQSFTVEVKDGNLDLELLQEIQNPSLKGLAIHRLF
jgi:hypothetical protein